MKKNQIKRWLAILTAGAMLFCLAACTKGGDQSGQSGQSAAGTQRGTLFQEPTELSIVISDHVSWPYNENWKMWQYLREATGAELKVQAIPAADYKTKIALMMSTPSELPDLMHIWEKPVVDEHAAAGAFLSYTDRMDKMPNLQAFLNTLSEEERQGMLAQRTSGDGKIYSAPSYGTGTVQNLRTWMYRKDIFDKHKLQPPTTFGELYQVCKTLKELYPDSYPLCFRTGFMKFDEWGPSWAKDWATNAYYDFDQQKWFYGAKSPEMKQMVEYMLKMESEGLVPPDYLTMQTKSFEELMSTDRGFITLEYVVRFDFFNVANREVNPDYHLALLAPPVPDIPGGRAKLMKSNIDFYGYCVCNTGRDAQVDKAFQFVDWMYSDEACELLSWGKEGETYRVADGKKEFILKDGDTPQNAYGVGTYGVYQRILPEAYEAQYTPQMVEYCHELMQYLEPQVNPTMWLPLEEDELQTITNLKSELVSFMEENLSKFLLRQRPMSEWNQFQKDLDSMGVEEMLSIYDTAYKRVMDK